MALIKLNNQSISAVSALPSGIDTGKIGQVVHAIDKTVGSFQLATSTLTDFMTVNITPSATSSKILVRFDTYWGTASNQNYPYVVLRRDNNDIYRANNSGNRQSSTGGTGFLGGNGLQCVSNEFLDSPNSSSEVSYVLKVAGYNNLVFYKNQTDDNNNQVMSACSQITATEILA